MSKVLRQHNTNATVPSRSIASDSSQPHGLQPAQLLCRWGFSRQEYWSGLPCVSPADLPDPGMEPRSPALQAESLQSKPPGKPIFIANLSSNGKESACNAGDLGSITGSGRSAGEGNGQPLQYSFLENSMDREAWLATVHGVTKSQTQI